MAPKRKKAASTIWATDGHSCWSPTERKWITAGNLKPGTVLRADAGKIVQVAKTRPSISFATVRNLTVERDHTYYVLAGNTPVLVHNCDIGTLHSGKSLANNRAGMNVHGKNGFSGVYDPESSRVYMQVSGGPGARVGRAGGHGDINDAIFNGSDRTVGFVALLNDEGQVAMRWNSRSVNEVNFGDRAAPMEHRQSIMDEIARMTRLPVIG